MQYGQDADLYSYDVSRIPHFFFKEEEEGIDNEKSNELGYPVPKLITYIYITPSGQKGGPSPFHANEFIARKKQESKQGGGWNPNWVRQLEDSFRAFKEGKELPVNGTPLITYERIAKKRREELAYQYPTVEDLAAVPDGALTDIGLDGRVLRDLARNDIKAKKGLEPVVKELADANETIRRQEEMLTRLSERLERLEAKSKKIGASKRIDEEDEVLS